MPTEDETESGISRLPQVEQIAELTANANISHIYMNGFSIAHGNGDIILIAQLNALPTATINMSFTLAKTLAKKLGEVIDSLEESAETTILTTNDWDRAIRKTLD